MFDGLNFELMPPHFHKYTRLYFQSRPRHSVKCHSRKLDCCHFVICFLFCFYNSLIGLILSLNRTFFMPLTISAVMTIRFLKLLLHCIMDMVRLILGSTPSTCRQMGKKHGRYLCKRCIFVTYDRMNGQNTTRANKNYER